MHEMSNNGDEIKLAVSHLLEFNEVFREASSEAQAEIKEHNCQIISSFKNATPEVRLKIVENVGEWYGKEVAKRPMGQHLGHYARFFNGVKTLYEKSQQSPQLANKVDECLEVAVRELNPNLNRPNK